MKRRHHKNYNESGHAHHLTFSCYRRYAFLKAERSCQWLADAINDARREFRFHLWTYVFMPDHAHLIVYPTEPHYDIAAIRKSIKAPVGAAAIAYLAQQSPQWLPRITRRRGSRVERLFWQSGGGYDRNIDDRGTLLEMIDYVHLNPVRKKLVAQARDWKWSSAAWYEGLRDGPLAIDPIPAQWLAGS